MIPYESFPRLNAENHRITSPASLDYNCIAWSTSDTEHWWQPGVYWPTGLPHDDFSIGALQKAFLALGYEVCEDDRLEPDFEKVALYAVGSFYAHAARQLPDGKWTSKLGKFVDIEHDTPDDVAGGCYGEIMQYLKRKR